MLAYLIQRTMRLTNDMAVTLPVRLCQHKEDAEALCMELQRGMTEILKCRAVMVQKTGEGVDTGIPVGGFLRDLGVVAFEHRILPIEVKGTILDAPQKELVSLS